MYRILSAFAVGLLAACAAPAASSCRAVPPAAIAAGTATWIGPCDKGAANGVGTLRVAHGNGAPALFFGRMVAGRPFSGVMTASDGDWRPAWRFDAAMKPRDDPDGSRQSSVHTFRLAEAGAREASRRFRAGGNAASAKFYDEQARRLAEALD